MENHIELGF